MQLGGSKLSSLMTSQPSSSRRDSQRDRRRNQVRNYSGGRRNEEYELVAKIKVPSTDREKSPSSRTQQMAQGASSSLSPNTGRCSVGLANDHTMDQ